MTDDPGDCPDGAALLWQARETLMAELLPTLREPARLSALMIANAISIAARELEDQHRQQAVEEGPAVPPRVLVAEIRAGKWDGDPVVHEMLNRETIRHLEIANPKALKA